MPSVDDLLRKNKDRLEKAALPSPRKKIVREGATRPWQVNLPQYNKGSQAEQAELNNQVDRAIKGDGILENLEPHYTHENALEPLVVVGSAPTPNISEVETKGEQSGSKTIANKKQSSSKVAANEQQTDSKVVANEEQSSSESTKDENLEQSDSKVVANGEQSDSKPIATETSSYQAADKKPIPSEEGSGSELVPKVVANLEQTGSKPVAQSVANYEQTSSTPAPHQKRTDSKLVAQPVAELVANLEQTGSNLTALVTFSKLAGIQRTLTLYIYEECKRLRSKITDEISIADLIKIANSETGTVKNAVNRLIQKGVTRRFEFKDGRAGWTRYELSDLIYREIRDREMNGRILANWEQTGSKPVAEPVAQPVAPLSSSSSDLNIPKTTTTEKLTDRPTQLPPDWDEIDYSCLGSIHFKKDHIKQIYEAGKVSAETVQNSIYELHHDLTSGGQHGLRSPLNVFMKALRVKGESYTATTPGYVSDEVKYERKRLEELRRRNDERMHIHQEEERLRHLPFKVKDDETFEAWRLSLTPEQRREYAPTAQQEGSPMQLGLLRAHWQSIQNDRGVDSGESKLREDIRRQIDLSLLGSTT